MSVVGIHHSCVVADGIVNVLEHFGRSAVDWLFICWSRFRSFSEITQQKSGIGRRIK